MDLEHIAEYFAGITLDIAKGKISFGLLFPKGKLLALVLASSPLQAQAHPIHPLRCVAILTPPRVLQPFTAISTATLITVPITTASKLNSRDGRWSSEIGHHGSRAPHIVPGHCCCPFPLLRSLSRCLDYSVCPAPVSPSPTHMLTLANPFSALYAHKINTLFLYDVNDPTQWGFASMFFGERILRGSR